MDNLKERFFNKFTICFYIVYVIILFLICYFGLPTINFRAKGFYAFLAYILIIPCFVILNFVAHHKIINGNVKDTYKIFNINKKNNSFSFSQDRYVSADEYFSPKRNLMRTCLILLFGFIAMEILIGITGAKIFNAKKYAEQLSIVQTTTEELNQEFDYDDNAEDNEVILPTIDKDLAFKFAQAKLEKYGAQYSIDKTIFTIMSVERDGKTELIRVTPLEYATKFVALSKYNSGTIGYIEVNCVTKVAKLVTFDENNCLKYMPSAVFKYDLKRHIYSKYPTLMYDEKYFEIDNYGNPYWVIPTVKKEIGICNGETPYKVLIVNPITGEMNLYDLGKEPVWTQRCVDESAVEAQANNALKYKNGYWNTYFAKKEVFNLSDGYNYINKNGETYYISCITSPNENDQTSIGFISINLKTKETKRYSAPGITEMRAREIAMYDERVKAQVLEATWPILISYKSIPTYFVVLKNDVQSQKVVLINADDGAYVAIEDNIQSAFSSYDKLVFNKNNDTIEELTLTGTVTNIRDLGNTIEFTLNNKENYYFVVDVNLSLDARFLNKGDIITIKYKEYSNYGAVTSLSK